MYALSLRWSSRAAVYTSASASGVCTLPRRTGRSAVASYSSIVITLRAWTRKSSGGVLLSRRPRRPSATSGCLLTCSAKLVTLDEPADRVDRDRQHAVHVRRLEVVDVGRTHLAPSYMYPMLSGAVDAICPRINREGRKSTHVNSRH